MNKTIKSKIENVLKAEMEYTKRAFISEEERTDRMKDIILIKEILDQMDKGKVRNKLSEPIENREDYEHFRL